ncbi:MAG: TldD/PmbA family protein [Pyrinomonadaceae bacterium MAG19_C2-C3]|nr:TldD/PmbA family protein [Pyrinomonadaceae bacterium MAG19_C2-C3]
MLLTEKDARDLTGKLLSFVKADDASVSVTNEQTSHLRFADNNVLTSGKRESRAASVTLWMKGRRGAASTNDFDDASLRAAVEQAEQIARLAPVDREYLPTLGKQTYKPVGGYVEATANISPATRARQIGDILTACEKAKVIGAGFHQAVARAAAFATKNGNFGFEPSTVVSLSTTARTPDGTSSGYFGRNHFDVAKLDTARIAREAIDKTLQGRNARTLEAKSYTVILEPQAVADLLGNFAFGFDARSAEEGRSPYSASGGKTRTGEKLFDERINLYSDASNAELPASPSAQAGIPSQKIYLIKNGVLENLIYSRFWAKQKGTEPTPGPVNAILETTGKPTSVEEMISSTKRGLLVSRFWYIRSTDPRTASLTGLTRDGVWLIEDGKIQYPVKNFRFNQSIINMLAPGNVEMIGAAERVGNAENASLLPALKLKAFNFTSQSEAV